MGFLTILLMIAVFTAQTRLSSSSSIKVAEIDMLDKPYDSIEDEFLNVMSEFGITRTNGLIRTVHNARVVFVNNIGHLNLRDEYYFKSEITTAIKSFSSMIKEIKVRNGIIMNWFDVFRLILSSPQPKDVDVLALDFVNFLRAVSNAYFELVDAYYRGWFKYGRSKRAALDEGNEYNETSSETSVLLETVYEVQKEGIIKRVYKGIIGAIKAVKAFFKAAKAAFVKFPLIKKFLALWEKFSFAHLHTILVDYLGDYDFINGEALAELDLANFSLEKLRDVFNVPDVSGYVSEWQTSISESISYMIKEITKFEKDFKNKFGKKDLKGFKFS